MNSCLERILWTCASVEGWGRAEAGLARRCSAHALAPCQDDSSPTASASIWLFVLVSRAVHTSSLSLFSSLRFGCNGAHPAGHQAAAGGAGRGRQPSALARHLHCFPRVSAARLQRVLGHRLQRRVRRRRRRRSTPRATPRQKRTRGRPPTRKIDYFNYANIFLKAQRPDFVFWCGQKMALKAIFLFSFSPYIALNCHSNSKKRPECQFKSRSDLIYFQVCASQMLWMLTNFNSGLEIEILFFLIRHNFGIFHMM